MLNEQPSTRGSAGEPVGYAHARARADFDRVAGLLLEKLIDVADELDVQRVAGELGGYVVMATVSEDRVPSVAAISAGSPLDVRIYPYGEEMRVVYGVRVSDLSQQTREKYEECAR